MAPFDSEFGDFDWTALSVYRGPRSGTLPAYDGEPSSCAPDAGVWSVGIPEPRFWVISEAPSLLARAVAEAARHAPAPAALAYLQGAVPVVSVERRAA